MKNRTKAWVIFLVAVWFYPGCKLYSVVRRFVRESLDSIEKYLDRDDDADDADD